MSSDVSISGDEVAGPPAAKPERLRKGRTLAERRAERRQALLDAALELFGTQGFLATSVEEICRTAYVSTRNFYEEFDNREALLVALGEQIVGRTFRAMAEVEVIEPGPDQGRREARARIGVVVHSLVDDPRVARVSFIESRGVSPVHEARRRDANRLFADFVIGLGDGPRSDFWDRSGGEIYGLAVVGAFSEVVGDWVLRDDKAPLDELIDDLTEFVLLLQRALARP